MGENQGLVWILLAFMIIFIIGVQFAQSFNIPANFWFSGVTTIGI